MPATIDLTQQAMFTAVGTVLTALLGIEVIQGQANRSAEPVSDDYLVMTELTRPRLATNVETWDETNPNPTVITSKQSTQAKIQCDLHGPNAADNAQILTTLLRSSYGCALFAALNPLITPLHTEEPRQTPFINGEQQYEDRWSVDLALQINPTVTTPQDFANRLAVGLIDVDATYPPGG